jgi:hypothetical protein
VIAVLRDDLTAVRKRAGHASLKRLPHGSESRGIVAVHRGENDDGQLRRDVRGADRVGALFHRLELVGERGRSDRARGSQFFALSRGVKRVLDLGVVLRCRVHEHQARDLARIPRSEQPRVQAPERVADEHVRRRNARPQE